MKRTAVGALGTALVVDGLRQRSLGGTATALAGGWLLARALGGTDGIRRVLSSETGVGRRGAHWTESSDATAASRSITIGKPADELYEVWRDPEQLSRIVGPFVEVTAVDEDRIRWTVDAPHGREIAWETSFVAEDPGELLRWKTPSDASLPNEGSIRFRPAPGDRGTEVTLSISFDPPGGTLGAEALDKLDVVPETLAGQLLARCKSLVESGEIPTLEGNPSARGKGEFL